MGEDWQVEAADQRRAGIVDESAAALATLRHWPGDPRAAIDPADVRLALTEKCDHCRSARHRRCTAGTRELANPHPSRVDKARARLAQEATQ